VPVFGAGGGAGDGAPEAGGRRLDQPRWVPRQPGLFVFTALGSRGITQAALGGEVLAAWLAGDPLPAPASLLDALDPARFIARAARRAA
jgi:tRNA 5-methylaminomethyl-2-thiouridine biosynthesis bifunctional protein